MELTRESLIAAVESNCDHRGIVGEARQAKLAIIEACIGELEQEREASACSA